MAISLGEKYHEISIENRKALTYTVREEAEKAGMGGMGLGHAMGSTLTTNPSKGLWYIGIDQKSPGAALERKM